MSTTTSNDVGAHVRRRRLKAELTQVQLATAAGVSLCTITNFERGAVPKRSTALPKILSALSREEAHTGELQPAV